VGFDHTRFGGQARPSALGEQAQPAAHILLKLA
jgi:hypothetical protein